MARPKGTMTKLRLKVLEEYALSESGIPLAELARRCRLYDYRAARRIVRDLRSMGEV